MREKMRYAFWRFKMNAWEKVMKEEKGASDMVAIIVIIVILIAVAAVFKDELEQAIQKAFENLRNFTDSPGF